MSEKIIRNSAKCAHCSIEIESVHRHDFKTHQCEAAGKVARTYNHEKQEYEPAYPQFWVDGGRDYIRRMFTRLEDFVDTSVFE